VKTIKDVKRLGAFLANDFEMVSSPFEGEWRGANNAEESGRTPVFAGARPALTS
jgi:hypothetical protein